MKKLSVLHFKPLVFSRSALRFFTRYCFLPLSFFAALAYPVQALGRNIVVAVDPATLDLGPVEVGTKVLDPATGFWANRP